MLNPRHDGCAIQRPLTLRAIDPTLGDVLAELRALRQPGGQRAGVEGVPHDCSGAFALEDFVRRTMHVRDDLAWKSARGLTLTTLERATLRAFDGVLDAIEGPPPALAREVQELLRAGPSPARKGH